MLVTQSLRHCLNKYKLAREGEKDNEKEDCEKVKGCFFFFSRMKSSSVERDEFAILISTHFLSK